MDSLGVDKVQLKIMWSTLIIVAITLLLSETTLWFYWLLNHGHGLTGFQFVIFLVGGDALACLPVAILIAWVVEHAGRQRRAKETLS